MTYIIHGATGAQGGPVLRRLTQAGRRGVAGSRHGGNRGGIAYVHLDNASVDSLAAAYRGADGVFVHLPQTVEENRVNFARNIAKAVEIAKPGRVVISTSGLIVDEPDSPLHAPANSAISLLIDGVQQTGVSTAVIAPRLYLENLLLPMVLGPVQAEGMLRYPLRADFPVSWSSHLDVAEVAERLLTDSLITGVVGVGQLPGLSGADLAEGFTRHLGREVVFESIQPEDFGKLVQPILGPATGAVIGLYQALSTVPANTIIPISSAQQRLGITPCTVPQWLRKILG
ncbi:MULTISPECIES: SDR family oxidoreductase [Stenotrophomonas]|jgi:uncharacterized protein YbjT (DUF2867 family)|uniref:SDR family oxidoreductase n=1 Tax=Stenotrophomonas TaxID=40323 RepID=UPI0004195753|nr:NAD(P)H-binding protein [Stenotrophomonas maltophilia]OHY71855.1 hydroxylase [Stenotrophomonas maltophilia]